MTFNAMLNSPARLSQPHLHPDKINGALWFGIDPSVNSFIRATWQGYYMGPWRVGGRFLMKGGNHGGKGLCKISIGTLEFNDLVYGLWKKETWTTIGERISKKKRQHKKPNYINDADWTLLLENWRPMQLKRRAKRLQNLASLILATHTRPDETFLDYRAEELVTQAEMEGTQLSNTEGSPGVQLHHLLLLASKLLKNVVYNVLCYNAKGKRGHVYGLGSAQYREYAPSSRVPNGLARNLELEMRVGGLETSLQSVTADIAEVKQDVSEMKQDFAATRDGINQLLQTLRPQQAPTGQTSAQPQAPTTQS
ncbi:hypothetical protein F2Q69_00015694 [Brassica cretica]|uniref:Uncharacterized protein n=1 Tax=Brassica cretica TaxID=69181 RepID=A0A8S9QSG4_BRACR|nr:hypothetical protein F2Q69_00015694 [Brassica cretica]